jgi:hypothetical protein
LNLLASGYSSVIFATGSDIPMASSITHILHKNLPHVFERSAISQRVKKSDVQQAEIVIYSLFKSVNGSK